MHNSKIVDVRTRVFELPLKKTWEIALYAANTRAHAVVRLETEDGIVGYGEASPSPAFMGETGYTIETVINRYIKEVVVGENLFDIAKIHQKMDASIDGNTAAKAAVDIAVYDAMGKSLGLPVYTLLGGKVRSKMPLSWVVGLQDFQHSLEEARQRVQEGYGVIKIKVGKDLEKDVNLIHALREELGSDVRLRLDANQGFTPREAVTLLERVRDCLVESIEQPVRKWDLQGLRFVRDNARGVPVMADESASNIHDLCNVVRHEAADIFNVKVGKVGGLYRACQMAGIIEAAGLKGTAGSNLEVSIGEAASVHFVASQPVLSYPNDMLLGSELHRTNLVAEPLLIEKGQVVCPEKPGLGIDVDSGLFKK
ncbi:MAG: hypothetical protein CSA35_00345 [Dethiosulfovibrio peptidovorans]|nr:MAG: hypothetical protein CSA35_00345 [Dethiosulfovibrio peptidovorans]